MKNNKVMLLLPILCVTAVIILLLMGLRGKGKLKNVMITAKVFPHFQLSELQTGKPLTEKIFVKQDNKNYSIVNVWASWCVVCATEHPFLVSLAEQGVTIIGLNYRDTQKAAISVLSRMGDPYQQVIFDPTGTLALDLGVIGTPETYLINQQGMIIARYNGVLTQAIWSVIFEPIIAPSQER